jgi:hypothetical protein
MITEFSSIQRDYFISDIAIRASDGTIILYVLKDRVSEKVQKGYVSRTQLENLTKKLSQKYSAESEVVYIKSQNLEELGKGFEVLLKGRFQDEIDDVSLTFLTAQKVNVWLKATEANDIKRKQLRDFLVSILSPANIDIVAIQWVTSEDDIPSLMVLMLMAKKIQPANLDCYMAELSKSYFRLNKSWINKQLNKLIKKKLLIRDPETKQYALTGSGLMVIPNSLSRSSSDIVRALDLGRRKWSN